MGRSQSRINFLNAPDRLKVAQVVMVLNHEAARYGRSIQKLIFEFVSRERIKQINVIYLNHDYETDVITFDYCDKNKVSGEIYLCLDVILENASDLNVKIEIETNRVVFHGFLHLLGFNDKTIIEMNEMRKREEECLTMLAELHE